MPKTKRPTKSSKGAKNAKKKSKRGKSVKKKKTKQKKTVKKPIKRSRFKYPGLEPSATSRIRREYLDQDYIDQLDDKEKEWLSNFNEEWLGANFNHPGKILHKGKKQKREIYNRNNARNRCILSVAKARNIITDEDPKTSMEQNGPANAENVENALIELIDSNMVELALLENKDKK